jgi:hypothetical protein
MAFAEKSDFTRYLIKKLNQKSYQLEDLISFKVEAMKVTCGTISPLLRPRAVKGRQAAASGTFPTSESI